MCHGRKREATSHLSLLLLQGREGETVVLVLV